jgi:hypothetical protein
MNSPQKRRGAERNHSALRLHAAAGCKLFGRKSDRKIGKRLSLFRVDENPEVAGCVVNSGIGLRYAALETTGTDPK